MSETLVEKVKVESEGGGYVETVRNFREAA